jgi:hypothetical protein
MIIRMKVINGLRKKNERGLAPHRYFSKSYLTKTDMPF